METFKSIEEVMDYDPRFDGFTGDYIYDNSLPSGLKLHHIYNKIKDINLHEEVHEDIQSQFNIAKNIFVYSWYCYPFGNVAELKAISTLEFALRLKSSNKRLGLRRLLIQAIDNGLIIESIPEKNEDEYFIYEYLKIEIPPVDLKERTKQTADFLSYYRNNLAHGSTTLSIPSSLIFEITSDFINQLF